MHGRAALILRRCLAVVSFVLCLPSLLLSATLLKDFLRIHRTEFYHFDYAYGTQFALWAAIAALLAGLAVYTFARRSYYGVLPAIAIMVGLVTVHLAPDMDPRVSMLSTTLIRLGHAEKALSDWDETHGRFPGDEDELREALTRVLEEPSHFSVGKTPVVCKFELLSNAVSASVRATVTQPCADLCSQGGLRGILADRNHAREPTSGRVIVATGIGDEPFVVHRTHLKPGEGYWPHFE